MAKNNEKDLQTELLRDLGKKMDKTQECVQAMDKKVDLGFQEVQHQFDATNKLDEQQNELLATHMRRTVALEKDVEIRDQAMNKRVSRVEAPFKWFSGTYKILISLGAIAGAVATIAFVSYKLFF